MCFLVRCPCLLYLLGLVREIIQICLKHGKVTLGVGKKGRTTPWNTSCSRLLPGCFLWMVLLMDQNFPLPHPAAADWFLWYAGPGGQRTFRNGISDKLRAAGRGNWQKYIFCSVNGKFSLDPTPCVEISKREVAYFWDSLEEFRGYWDLGHEAFQLCLHNPWWNTKKKGCFVFCLAVYTGLFISCSLIKITRCFYWLLLCPLLATVWRPIM